MPLSTSALLMLSGLTNKSAIVVDQTLKLNSFIGGAQYKLGNPDPVLNELFSAEYFPDQRIAALTFEDIAPPIASVVALDQEIPQMSRQAPVNIGKIPTIKIAIGRNISEAEMTLVQDNESIIKSLENTYGADPMMIENRLVVKPAELIQSALNLSAVLACQVAYTGRCSHTDRRTKIQTTFNYTDGIAGSSATSPNFRDPITSATLKWDAPATATPIADIVDHLRAIYAVYYAYPDIMMPKAVLDKALDTLNVRSKVAGLRGGIASNGAPDAAALNAMARPVMDEFRRAIISELGEDPSNPIMDSWKIIVDRGFYFEETFTAPGVQPLKSTKPYSPVNGYAFVPPGNIGRLFFPSLAAKYAQGNATANVVFAETFSGVFTVIGQVQGIDPPQESLTASALHYPLVRDNRMLGGRVVM
jgi:hypothetical protein